jgi:hypothetical protein
MQLYSLVGTFMEKTSKGLLGSRTRRTIVGILVIVVALSVVAYAYWRSLPSQAGPEVTLTSPPFELSLSLDKSAYSPTDNMTIAVYLRNISNETITAEIPYIAAISPNGPAMTLATVGQGVSTSLGGSLDGLCPLTYTLVANMATVIKIPSQGADESYSIIFEPGASLNQTLCINFPNYNELLAAPLQNGLYQVRVALERVSLNYKDIYTWETPSITFTLG